MRTIRVRAAALIPAPAERVYAILADYREGHPRILPPRNFVGFAVERGGRGEGTTLRCTLRLFGMSRSIRAAVSEPRPGRVLVESDSASGSVTTFTVAPVSGEPAARVTIETVTRVAAGPSGILAQLLVPALLRSVYEEELRRLASVAAEP